MRSSFLELPRVREADSANVPPAPLGPRLRLQLTQSTKAATMRERKGQSPRTAPQMTASGSRWWARRALGRQEEQTPLPLPGAFRDRNVFHTDLDKCVQIRNQASGGLVCAPAHTHRRRDQKGRDGANRSLATPSGCSDSFKMRAVGEKAAAGASGR